MDYEMRSHVKMGSGSGLVQLPVKEHWGPPEPDQGKEVPSPEPPEGEWLRWPLMAAPESDNGTEEIYYFKPRTL